MMTRSLFSGIFFLLCCAISLHAQSLQTGAAIAKYPLTVPAAVSPDPSLGGSSTRFELVHSELQADSSLLAWCYFTTERWNWNRAWNDDTPSLSAVTDNHTLCSVRMTPAGNIDSTYGNSGWVYYTLPEDINVESFRQIKIAHYPDGRVLVVATMQRQRDILAMRFLPDGRPDATFWKNGYCWFFSDLATEDNILDLALLPDGKARMALSSRYENQSEDCRILQLDANGFLDTSFSGVGVLTVLNLASVLSGQFLPDGRLVVAAYNMDWLSLYRFTADGLPDFSFGSYGVVHTRIESIYADFISVWPDGSLLISGRESIFCETGQPGGKFNNLRYHSNGLLDSGFEWSGGDGWTEGDYLRNLTILNDTTYCATLDGAHGSRILYFSATGKLLNLTPVLSERYSWNILPLAGHKQLITAIDGNTLIVLRLLPDGKPDPAYGLDSLALRSAGYYFNKEKEAPASGFDLQQAPEAISVSSYPVLVLSDSLSGSRITVTSINDANAVYASALTLRHAYSLKEAAQLGNAGNDVNLQLSNLTFAARMPEFAAIPADRLKGLSLLNCQLDRIPAVLRQFGDLELLEIRYDPASPSFKPSLKSIRTLLTFFPKLKFLILALPEARKAPKALGDFKDLTLLELDMPGLTTFPEAVCRLGNLTELRLYNVVHSVTIPSSIGDLANLEVLDISGTGITALPDSIARCVRLRKIKVQTTGAFAAFPDEMLTLPDLEQFHMEICQPSRELKMQVAQLRDISSRKNRWSTLRMYDPP